MRILPFLSSLPVAFTLFLTLPLPQLAFSQHVPPDCPIDRPVGPRCPHPRPDVSYPTIEEILDYLNKTGIKKEFGALSNATHGEPSNVQAAMAGNTTWIAWQGKIEGINRIFLTGSFDAGTTFTEPVLLSHPNGGNASNLQLGLSEGRQYVFAAWQEEDPADPANGFNVTSRIIFSSSMDYGRTFKTYSLNLPGDGNATDPHLTVEGDQISLTWTQEGDSYCTVKAPGTIENISSTQVSTSETTALQAQAGEEPDMIVCIHGARW
jgi:hypothetical protein